MKAIILILMLAIIGIAGCATEAEYGQREDEAFFRWLENSPE